MGIDIDKLNQQANTTQRYEAMIELADCLIATGKVDEAQKYYEQAAVVAPDEAAPYIGLGVSAFTRGQFDDAENAFKVAKRLAPDNAKAYCGLAMTAQQKNNPDAAFDFYLKSLELDGDNLTALLGMFQMSCKTGSFSKVIYYLEIYLKSHPKDTSVMFSLAALYIRQGQMDNCRKLLDKILFIEPGNKDAAALKQEIEKNK
ncbi:MAG: tetratricopeptide repeat protein [Phycisphaerae bacterium]|jgi:tetratricopeptide (TPR) repeat protein